MPLCTSATPWLMCGCALASVTPPWVAQRCGRCPAPHGSLRLQPPSPFPIRGRYGAHAVPRGARRGRSPRYPRSHSHGTQAASGLRSVAAPRRDRRLHPRFHMSRVSLKTIGAFSPRVRLRPPVRLMKVSGKVSADTGHSCEPPKSLICNELKLARYVLGTGYHRQARTDDPRHFRTGPDRFLRPGRHLPRKLAPLPLAGAGRHRAAGRHRLGGACLVQCQPLLRQQPRAHRGGEAGRSGPRHRRRWTGDRGQQPDPVCRVGRHRRPEGRCR